MNCERLSERMPEVAAGRGQWTADERAHLAQCADCTAEWRLVEATGRLGTAVDPERISAAVRARLAAEPMAAEPVGEATSTRDGVASVARGRRSWIWGLAAAAVVILAVSLDRRGPDPIGEAGAPAGPVLTELDELTATELETVLVEFEEPSAAPDGGTGDLSTDELQQVLQDWES